VAFDPFSHPGVGGRELIRRMRLVRFAGGVLVGGALSLSGALVQSVVRNPLADPYLLGFAGGAGLGAALAVIWGSSALVPLLSFVLSLGVGLSTIAISSSVGGGLSSLVLVGFSLSSIASSVLALLMYASGYRLHSILFWLWGGLDGLGPSDVLWLSGALLLGLPASVLISYRLNLLLLGDEVASSLGVDPRRLKLFALGLCALLTSTSVSRAGTIGFVGLMVPHMARLILRSFDNRMVVPSSAFLGGLLLVLCDLVARWAIWPAELPLGIITTALGAPFFLFLLRRSKGRAP